jgi:hypothetical protein
MTIRFDDLPLLRVPLTRIDWNNTACLLRFGREPSQRLVESLRRTGMRTPPLLAKGKSALFIVCGFERLRIWRELGHEDVAARIAPPEAAAQDLLSAAIEENQDARGLNLIEQAIALEKWAALRDEVKAGHSEENGLKPALRTRDGLKPAPRTRDGLKPALRTRNGLKPALRTRDGLKPALRTRDGLKPAPRTKDELLSLLGYKPGPAIIERLRAFRKLSTAAQTALAQGTFPEGAAATLREFPAEEQDHLVSIMLALRFTAGMCRDFSREFLETCRREKIAVTALLRELGLDHPLGGTPQEIALLRRSALEALHRRRFPILSRLERDFAAHQAALGLGDEVQLRPPKDFEGDQYHLDIRVSNLAQLDRAVRALAERLDKRRDEIERLFHVTWEP